MRLVQSKGFGSAAAGCPLTGSERDYGPRQSIGDVRAENAERRRVLGLSPSQVIVISGINSALVLR